MPNRTEFFKLNNRKMIGKILYTAFASAEIINIKVPIMKNILVISKEDLSFPDVSIYGVNFPILAGNYSAYKGQPLLAVFARDVETLDLLISEIEVEYKTEEEEDDKVVTIKTFYYGNVEDFFSNENNKFFSSEYTIKPHSESLIYTERFFSCFNENVLHIKFTSQWPFHVKKCLCKELELKSDQVVMYLNNYTASFDQLLIQPSCASVIVAVASKIVDGLVELDVDMESNQIPLSFSISSCLNEDNKILAQRISVKADMGAYPMFKDEFSKNIIAGLVSPYKMDAITVNIEIKKTDNPPANFFGDIGYSAAFSALENHISLLSDHLGIFPDDFRLINLLNNDVYSQVFKASNINSIREALVNCSDASKFKRLYAVNSLPRPGKNSINPQIDYFRGIGISCGNGVLGFSLTSDYLKATSISLTLSKDKKLYLKLGTQIRENIRNICFSILNNYLQIRFEDIIFQDINTQGISDLGPVVLSKNRELLPRLLYKAIDLMKEALNEPEENITWPINVSASYHSVKENHLFNPDSFGSMAISLHMDPVSLTPVIDKIWVRLNIGKTFDISKLESQVRMTISLEIAKLCPSVINDYEVDVKITTDENDTFSAATSLIKGLTSSAFTSALSQALNHRVCSVPFSAEDSYNVVNTSRNVNLTKSVKKDDGVTK